MAKVNCPACNHPNTAKAAGATVDCGACGHKFGQPGKAAASKKKAKKKSKKKSTKKS